MGVASCIREDPLAGGCNYWLEYDNGDCRKPVNNIIGVSSTESGGFVGAGSRCWTTDLPSILGYPKTFACYTSQCISSGT